MESVLITLDYQNFNGTEEFAQTEDLTTVDRGYLNGDAVAVISEPTAGTASVEKMKKHPIRTHCVTSDVFGYKLKLLRLLEISTQLGIMFISALVHLTSSLHLMQRKWKG